MPTIEFTPAEQAYIARQDRVRFLFKRARNLTAADVARLASKLTLAGDSRAELVGRAAELAAEFGREAEYAKARRLAKDGALDAHTVHTGAIGRVTGDDYPLWNGPGFENWETVWNALADWAGALIVAELDPGTDFSPLAIDGFFDGTFWKEHFERAGEQ